MNIPQPLSRVLSSTGFILDGKPVPELLTKAERLTRSGQLKPDAIWKDRTGLEVVFKSADGAEALSRVASWHREAWNIGLAPLLWIVSPERIDVYNTYERPTQTD